MNKLRPIRIFWQHGVSAKQIFFTVRVISAVLRLLGINKKIKIQTGDTFDPFMHENIDANSSFCGQYDAVGIIDDPCFRIYAASYEKFYPIFLMRDKIFMYTNNGIRAVGGVAIKGDAAVISAGHDSLFASDKTRRYRFCCIVVHELGHIFGLPSEKRKGDEIELSSVNESRHCANFCVMSPSLHDGRHSHVFCPTCLRELFSYFEETNEL